MQSAFASSPKISISNQLFNNKPVFQTSSQEYPSTNPKLLSNMWNLELQSKQLSAKTHHFNGELSFAYTRNDSEQKTNDTNQYNAAADLILNAMEITDIMCEDGDDGYFKTNFIWKNNDTTVPIFDEQVGYLNGDTCLIVVTDNKMIIDLKSSSFNLCGVKNCLGDNGSRYLCLRLRFLTTLGLKLPEDLTLTIRCGIQEHMISYVQRLGLSVNEAVSNSRNLQRKNKIATGGANNTVRCQLNAFRLTPEGQFTRLLRNGDAVSLGEELLLQIIIFNENVWRWSKLSDTWLSRSEDVDIVQLLSPNGCTLPQARAVCPDPPKQFGPFVHTLLIRAPMFANSLSESSVNLNVRVLACRHQRDCTSHCNRSSRTINFINKPQSYNKLERDNVLQNRKSDMKNLNITTENSNTLAYLSDAFENDYDDIRNQTNLNKNIFVKRVDKFNMTAEGILNSKVGNGEPLFWASSGRNYVMRSRREARGMMARADSVATLTFTVVQDESRVIAPTVNEVTNDTVIYAISSVCIVILGLLIAIVFVYCRCSNKHILQNGVELSFI